MEKPFLVPSLFFLWKHLDLSSMETPISIYKSDTLVCQSHGWLRFLEIRLVGQHWSASPHSQSSANTYSSRANLLPAHGSFEYLHVPEIAISTEVHITTNLMGDCNTSSHAVIKCLVCKGTWSACWSVWEGLRNTPCLITALKKIYISLHLALLLLFLMQFGKANPRRTSQTSSPIM